MMKVAEDIQRKLQSELESFEATQKELTKVVHQRQQLDGQLNENQIVKDELSLIKEDAAVFKSVGPILLKIDLVEAKQNVATRIDLINKELKKVDEKITSLEKKQDSRRETLSKLESQFQQAQVKAAMK